jgi:hypothetical protein
MLLAYGNKRLVCIDLKVAGIDLLAASAETRVAQGKMGLAHCKIDGARINLKVAGVNPLSADGDE